MTWRSRGVLEHHVIQVHGVYLRSLLCMLKYDTIIESRWARHTPTVLMFASRPWIGPQGVVKFDAVQSKSERMLLENFLFFITYCTNHPLYRMRISNKKRHKQQRQFYNQSICGALFQVSNRQYEYNHRSYEHRTSRGRYLSIGAHSTISNNQSSSSPTLQQAQRSSNGNLFITVCS